MQIFTNQLTWLRFLSSFFYQVYSFFFLLPDVFLLSSRCIPSFFQVYFFNSLTVIPLIRLPINVYLKYFWFKWIHNVLDGNEERRKRKQSPSNRSRFFLFFLFKYFYPQVFLLSGIFLLLSSFRYISSFSYLFRFNISTGNNSCCSLLIQSLSLSLCRLDLNSMCNSSTFLQLFSGFLLLFWFSSSFDSLLEREKFSHPVDSSFFHLFLLISSFFSLLLSFYFL